ncbi:MAG: hypothetical protein E7158_02270 [Firmicutes bacterium]|nr:hypothetical protein [Bacillota bacterium]
MLSKKKIKKLVLFLVVVLIFTIYKLIPKDYKISYKIDKYDIVESYLKKDKMYTFKIKKNNQIFETFSVQKYSKKRKLIKSIKEYKKNEEMCIILKSEKIDENIICKKNGQYIDYNLLNIIPKKYKNKYKNNKKKYENININLIDSSTYLIWNYTGFYKLSNKKLETITLFKDDVYNIDIVTIVGKYLVIADYNEKYNYNKLIRVNLKNNKIDQIELDEDISFDSRIIGKNKNNIYIIDNKNKKEYEINIKNKNFDKINKNKLGKVIKNGKWENIKLNKIITNNITFDNDNVVNYKIKDGLLKKVNNTDVQTKISDKNIKNIVYSDNNRVYYIVDDKLYKYDFLHGENKILEYFELNFNYENMIYIYD